MAPQADKGLHRYVRTPEAAKYLSLSPVTLEKDRVSGQRGIPFARIGSVVIYDLDRLDEWLAGKMVTSTSAADGLHNAPVPANANKKPATA
jgi:hypothetical protein